LVKGGLVGVILSLPDALVTRQKYAPILGLGLIGGIICGFFSKKIGYIHNHVTNSFDFLMTTNK
jgi:hypothetical protein